MDDPFFLEKVVLQPTTLCNLDCSYCYLPERSRSMVMSQEVATRLADGLSSFTNELVIIWHGGEPLACGLNHFRKLFSPFEGMSHTVHTVQTNATLIDKAWCEFFLAHDFQVGVSIDGPAGMNVNRVDWGSNPTHERTMRGVAFLREAGIQFHAIAVVGNDSLERAGELYAFFSELGCDSLGINFEEREGVNVKRDICDTPAAVQFWKELFEAWRARPVLEVREFSHALSWMDAICSESLGSYSFKLDLFPTVAWNGDVVLLSPELLGARCPPYQDFIVGNLLRESLDDILKRARSAGYVQDFIRGVSNCRKECQYFSYCGGGQACNKFYELGSVEGTETAFCRNTKKRLVDAILQSL